MTKRLSEIAVDRISPSMEKKAEMISHITARKVKKFGSKAFVTERGMRPFKGRILQLGRSGPTVHLTREGHHNSGGAYYPKSHVVAVNPSLFKKKGSVPFNTLTHELFHAHDPGLKKNEFKYANSDWRKDPQEVSAVLASNSLTGLKIGREIGVSDKKMRGYLRSGELMRDDPGLNKIAQIGRRFRQKVGKNLYRAYEREYHPETYVHREEPKMKLPEAISEGNLEHLRSKWSISPTSKYYKPQPEFDEVFNLWKSSHPNRKAIANTLAIAGERRAVSRKIKLPENEDSNSSKVSDVIGGYSPWEGGVFSKQASHWRKNQSSAPWNSPVKKGGLRYAVSDHHGAGCDHCGEHKPLWLTSRTQWNKLPPQHRHKVLCIGCYKDLRKSKKVQESEVNFSAVRSSVHASNAGRHTPNDVAVLRRARDTIRANKSHPWAKSPALMGAIKRHLGEEKTVKENVMHTKELLAYVVNHLVEEEAKKVRKPRNIKPSELRAMIQHSRNPRTKHGFSAAINHPEPGLVTFDKFFGGKHEAGHKLDTRCFSDQGRLCNFLEKHGVKFTQKVTGGPAPGGDATPAPVAKKTKKLKEMVDEDREF